MRVYLLLSQNPCKPQWLTNKYTYAQIECVLHSTECKDGVLLRCCCKAGRFLCDS